MKMRILLAVFICFIFLSCSENDEIDPEIDKVQVTNELLEFEYTPQIGTHEDRLKYKIKFINNSNVNIKGTPKITLNSDGIISTTIPSRIFDCSSIPAKSFCIYSFDITDNNPLIWALSIKFVKAEYIISN